MKKKLSLPVAALLFGLLMLLFLPLSAQAQDIDGDLMPDAYELAHPCLNAGLADGGIDYDLDAMTSLEEYQYSPNLDPCIADTDGDGVNDGIEVSNGANPLDNRIKPVFGIDKIGLDLRVTSNASLSVDPYLSWTGSEFGVSWDDGRDGNDEIYFTRVSSTGAKIGSDYRVTGNMFYSSYPALTWTGSEFGVSWQDLRDGNYEIYFTRISSAGGGADGERRMTSDAYWSGRPFLAWTGSEFGASWDDTRNGGCEIYFARVSYAGAKIGSDLRVTTDPGWSGGRSLSWTGSEFGLSFNDDRDGNVEIYFVRVSSSGVKIGSDLRVTYDASNSDYSSLTWTGSEFGISWQDTRDGNVEIYFARVSSSGVKIGGDLRVTSDASYSEGPSLSWTGSEFGVSWQDFRNDLDGDFNKSSGTMDYNYEIYFARVSSSGLKIGSDLRVTINASPSMVPSLSWTGSEFGVSWIDDRDMNNGNYEIYFARIGYTKIDTDGDGLDTAEEAAAGTNPADWDTDGDGASDGIEVQYGSNPLDNNIYPIPQQKIGSDIRVTYDPGFSEFRSLAWTGSEYGVSWADDRSGTWQVYFARLSALGAKIGADLRITYNIGFSGVDPLVWTGSEFAMTWQDNNDGNFEIYFGRISASGALIGSNLRVTYTGSDSLKSSLIWTGSEFGVSWQDEQIYFARISSSGVKIGSDLRVTGSALPSLTWTGSEFGVSWEDHRYGPDQIYFARISAEGAQIGPDVRVSYGSLYASYPSLVWSGSEYGASWFDERDGTEKIYFARLSAEGTMIGSDLRVSSNYGYYPNLVWTGSAFAVSWQYGDIFLANISSSGLKIGDDFQVTYDVNVSEYPSLVWAGSEFAVSWRDNRDGNYEIYFARIRPSDLDGDGLTIADEATAGTNAADWDTDDDEVSDGLEVITYLTDPLNPDTDADGLLDGEEIYVDFTNPLNPDTDNGGELDGSEVAGGRDPLDGNDDLLPPSDLSATPLEGALVRLEWKESPSKTAAQYNLYWDNGTGVMNWTTPFASVLASSPLTYTTGPLTPDIPYQFGVRVELAGGDEDQNTQVVTAIPFLNLAGHLQACIKHPGTGHKFNGNLLLVKAEICVGSVSEVSQVRLQWKPEGGGAWSDVPAADGRPNPDPTSPYFVHWDVTGLAVGTYELRAIAYNLSMVPDPEPPISDFYIDKDHPDREMKTGDNGKPKCKAKGYTNTDLSLELVKPGEDKPAGLKIPQDALAENTTVDWGIENSSDHSGKVNPSQYHNPENFLRVDLESGQSVLANGKQAELIFSYQDDDQDGLVDGYGIEEDELWPMSWNPGSSKWEKLSEISVDKDKNEVHGKSGHCSLFALLDDRDNDHDGLLDEEETAAGTNRNLWDTDHDGLPDYFEVNSAGFNALDALDGGTADFDADGNPNVDEYWNGTDPLAPNATGDAGCYYWGDAGMGDGIVSPGDLIELKKAISGGVGNYGGVIPGNGETQELDMDGYISPDDLIILQKMIVESAIPILGSRPASLEILESPPAEVPAGATCHLAIGVKNAASSYTPGLGVLFDLNYGGSNGSATLLGGDGAAFGMRYDISGPIASSGRARIVIRLDSPGTIIISARLPGCGRPGIGRSSPEIVLDPAAVIRGVASSP